MTRISLGKAQKYLQTLKAQQGAKALPKARSRRAWFEEEQGRYEAVLNLELSAASLSREGVAADVTAQVQRIQEAFERDLALREDAARLKEAIFSANQRSGVSLMLSRQGLLTERLAALGELLRDVEGVGAEVLRPEQVTDEFIARLAVAGTPDSGAHKLRVLAFSPVMLRDRIRGLRVELNQLDEAIREQNATYRIEVNLSAHGRALLGIE
jgi:hypothetical protein